MKSLILPSLLATFFGVIYAAQIAFVTSHPLDPKIDNFGLVWTAATIGWGYLFFPYFFRDRSSHRPLREFGWRQVSTAAITIFLIGVSSIVVFCSPSVAHLRATAPAFVCVVIHSIVTLVRWCRLAYLRSSQPDEEDDVDRVDDAPNVIRLRHPDW